MQQAPVLFLVPGAATYPAFYDDFKRHVSSKGLVFHTVQLRTVEARTPAATLADDVELVRSHLADLCEQDRDIILMAHSFGGMPMTEGAKGFAKVDRQRLGHKGGIVHLIYITSIAAEVGESMASTNAQPGPDGPLVYDFMVDHVEYTGQDPERSAATNFNALPHDQGVEHAKRMPLHSKACFGTPLTYAAYAYIPTSYIRVLRDRCFPLWWQQRRIDTIEKSRGGPIDVYDLDADHCFMASYPREAAKIVGTIMDKLNGGGVNQ
ncbi:hypothetical protein LTR78_008115 [Recurvomyces mirabilis]|uniref:AB hydrolase-1 domain-containing protein n=1 Tax=Recurvomyces mirabilis TaxID=574656 RepID=A0AAE0WJ23_9PEZI|nr:hypothetical protein LTR78_008115 [Recurvomyces mirabilis]KAK5150685.1 hypothetical protein LTS14_009968 [Recurvomyces mirabilis]